MSSEWKSVEIASICEGIFDGPHATPQKTVDGPVFLGISSLESGRLNLANTEHLSEEDFAKWTKRVVPCEGDIVFSYETRLGDVAMIPASLRCCLGRRMALMRIDRTKALPEYVLYAYMSPNFQDVIRARTIHGSTVDRIPLTEFGTFPILVPNLQTQKEIATVLRTLDDRIALLRETNATLEAIAQALFKSWFVDFDPVHAKAQGIAPEGMDEATAALFPDSFEESELGLVPKGWKIKQLGELCILQKGCSYKGAGLSENEGAHMFNLGCFNAPRVFATEKIKRYTGEYRDRHAVVAGDLIVANTDMTQDRAILGRPLIVPRGFSPAFISHHVFKLEPKNEPQSDIKTFLFFAFLQPLFRERAVGYAIGTTVLALPKDALQLHKLLQPDDSLISKFTDIAGATFSAIEINLQKITTLATIRDTLLPRLISGQLRLPEAEVILEEAVA